MVFQIKQLPQIPASSPEADAPTLPQLRPASVHPAPRRCMSGQTELVMHRDGLSA
jgi:hypothetical protein